MAQELIDAAPGYWQTASGKWRVGIFDVTDGKQALVVVVDTFATEKEADDRAQMCILELGAMAVADA